MPRQVRIEYPGAIYHGMARGARREAIVVDDEDRDRFRKLLGELVRQTGWEVFAWVLNPPRKRSGWVQVTRGLEQKGIRSDTAKSRLHYQEHLEAIARERGGVPDLPGGGERSLHPLCDAVGYSVVRRFARA